jgi:hypothetical protein
METGIRPRETKKSRLETRSRRASGTRRWRRVFQITIAAEKVALTTKRPASAIHSAPAIPTTANGREPRSHMRGTSCSGLASIMRRKKNAHRAK